MVTCNCWPGGIICRGIHYSNTYICTCSILHGSGTEFRLACTNCTESSAQRKAFLRFACLVILDNAVHVFSIAAVAMQNHARKSLYFLLIKAKMADNRFLVFVVGSLAEAYLHTSPPQGHSMVGVPKRCGGFKAIWLCAPEEFADNHFQLLFVYMDGAVYIAPFSLVLYKWCGRCRGMVHYSVMSGPLPCITEVAPHCFSLFALSVHLCYLKMFSHSLLSR